MMRARRTIKLLLSLAIWFYACIGAQAQNCAVYPNILTNGTTADANQVMADFNLIRNCANSNLAHSGANSDLTSITGLTTPLAVSQGGTPLFVGGTSTGSANAQVVASTTPNSFSLTQGFLVSFVAGFSNTGSTTLNVFSLGVKTIQKMSGGALVALASGDIITGTEYFVTWDGTVFELLNPSAVGVTGAASSTNNDIVLFSGTSGTALKDSAVTFPTVAAHQTLIATSASALAAKTVPDCPTSGSNRLNYTQSTDAFSCGSTAIPGTLTAGSVNTLNPLALSANNTVAHGLSRKPDFVNCFLENITGEFGYSAGDRIMAQFGTHFSVTNMGIMVRADATNTYLLTGSASIVEIINASDNTASHSVTAANWKLTCTPFLIN